MSELLLEKNRELYFEHFKLDGKKFFYKRLLLAFLLLIIYACVLFKTQNLWLLFGVPIVMFIGFKIPYMELISKKSKSDIVKQYIFPTFLRYFISLMHTHGNVFQTLKATIPYVQEPIKQELQNLVDRLERQNVQNREAFMEFAEFIGSSDAHMIMGMIYEFHEEGIKKSDLKELESTIKGLQDNKINQLIARKVQQMEKYANPIIIIALLYIFSFTAVVFLGYFKTISL